MKPVAFDYVQADSIPQVLELLSELGDDATLLAGGMSLGPMLNFRAATPAVLIDLNQVPDLDSVATNGATSTGAMLRQARGLAHSELMAAVPLLKLALPWVGHYQTRSRGTFGGSVAHADPSAEIPLCLVTLGGEVELRSKAISRRVPAGEFFEGVLTTARSPSELVYVLHWPAQPPRTGYAFLEEAHRQGDFALTAAAARVTLDGNGRVVGGALGFGGLEDRPVAFDLEPHLGASPDDQFCRDAAAEYAARADAIGDHVAPANYRRNLARVLGARALRQAADNAVGGDG